jgi:hypothetical protein
VRNIAAAVKDCRTQSSKKTPYWVLWALWNFIVTLFLESRQVILTEFSKAKEFIVMDWRRRINLQEKIAVILFYPLMVFIIIMSFLILLGYLVPDYKFIIKKHSFHEYDYLNVSGLALSQNGNLALCATVNSSSVIFTSALSELQQKNNTELTRFNLSVPGPLGLVFLEEDFLAVLCDNKEIHIFNTRNVKSVKHVHSIQTQIQYVAVTTGTTYYTMIASSTERKT